MSRDGQRDPICGSAPAPPCVGSVSLGFEHRLVNCQRIELAFGALSSNFPGLFGAVDCRYMTRKETLAKVGAWPLADAESWRASAVTYEPIIRYAPTLPRAGYAEPEGNNLMGTSN